MPRSNHRGDVLFTNRSVSGRIRERADASFAGKNQSSIQRTFGNRRGKRFLVIDANAGVVQRSGNTSGPKPTPGHCPCARITKGAIIDIARLNKPIGDGAGVRRRAIKATHPDFTVKIGGKFCSCRRKSFDIA